LNGGWKGLEGPIGTLVLPDHPALSPEDDARAVLSAFADVPAPYVPASAEPLTTNIGEYGAVWDEDSGFIQL